MSEANKKNLLILAGVSIVIWLITRPRKAVRYTQGVGTMTVRQIAESFREMIDSPLRVYINPTNPDDPETGTPWAVDLAGYIKNYEAVKAEYKKWYGGDLSDDLRAWFSGIELSEFVAELWGKSNQVMS